MPRGVRGSGRVKTPAAATRRTTRTRTKTEDNAPEEEVTGNSTVQDTTGDTQPDVSPDVGVGGMGDQDTTDAPVQQSIEQTNDDTSPQNDKSQGWRAINVPDGTTTDHTNASATATTLPQSSQDTSGQISGTTASSARPAPVSRVASLKSASASSVARSVSPAASLAGGKRAVKTPFFKGRRKQEDRDADKAAAAAKERQERLAREREEAERASAALKRARGGGDRGGAGGRGRGRGRGGFMGAHDRSEGVAGPFSAGIIKESRTYIQKARQEQKPGRVKSEEGIKSEKETVDGGYISSDPDDINEGPRFNVDSLKDLNIESDDSDVVPSTSTSTRKRRAKTQSNLVPVRLDRHEHKDRVMGINTDSSSAKAAETRKQAETEGEISMGTEDATPSANPKSKGKGKDVEVTGSRRFRGVWQGTDSDEPVDPAVKQEPTDEDVTMIEPGATAPQPGGEPIINSSSTSPERRRKSSIKTSAPSRRVFEKPALQTKEDEQEWARYQKDLQILREELGEIPADDTESKRSDRVYLFQLPPIMPSLNAPQIKGKASSSPELSRAELSAEKGKEPANPDVPGSSSSNPVPVSDIAKPKDTKHHPKEEAVTAPPQTRATKNSAKFDSGFVGKLRVYESGRAELDWGGTAFELQMGMEVEFLQDVVVVKRDEQGVKRESKEGEGTDTEEKREFGGDAMGFGQVRGKFVVTPNWDNILE